MSPELVAVLANIFAVQAEIAAMQCANLERSYTQSVMAYGEHNFWRSQATLERLSSEAGSLVK